MDNIDILVFTKTGCPPCSALKPVISEFENVTFLDAIENALEYNLRQAPTTIFKRDGAEIHRFTGFKDKNEITQLLEGLN